MTKMLWSLRRCILMKPFAKIFNCCKYLPIFIKSSILDVLQVSKFVSGKKPLQMFCKKYFEFFQKHYFSEHLRATVLENARFHVQEIFIKTNLLTCVIIYFSNLKQPGSLQCTNNWKGLVELLISKSSLLLYL